MNYEEVFQNLSKSVLMQKRKRKKKKMERQHKEEVLWWNMEEKLQKCTFSAYSRLISVEPNN